MGYNLRIGELRMCAVCLKTHVAGDGCEMYFCGEECMSATARAINHGNDMENARWHEVLKKRTEVFQEMWREAQSEIYDLKERLTISSGKIDSLVGYWVVHALANKIERMCLSCERTLDCECSEDTSLCMTEWCPSCLARKFMERHRTKSKGVTQETV
jgi:hypothetical protein